MLVIEQAMGGDVDDSIVSESSGQNELPACCEVQPLNEPLAGEQGRASIPMLKGLMPNFRFPQGSLVYFQLVFAAITPILFIGSVLGRIKFKVWL